MSDLLPKDDYFKHTTRAILTEAEKQEVLDAVERALTYLLEMSKQRKCKFTTFANDNTSFQMFNYRQRYLNRCMPLVKGSTQPPFLYRRQRRNEVATEAWRIAQETGASFQDVKEAFMNQMDGFISPYA